MNEYNIPIDKDLIFNGDFSVKSGIIAAKQIIHTFRKKKFEAIISSNDEMAITVLQFLTNNGIKVPYDIAITGFDDIEKCKHSFPSLTTVRQPIYLIGQNAIEILSDLIDGKKTPLLKCFETNFIIRESCGCGLFENSIKSLFNSEIKEISAINEKLISNKTVDYLKSFNSNNVNFEKFINEIIIFFFESLKKFSKDIFLNQFIKNLQNFLLNGYLIEILENILKIFFQEILSFSLDKKTIFFIYELILQTLMIVKNKSKQLVGKKNIQLTEFADILISLCRSMVIKYNKKEFYKNLANILSELEIKSCSFVFFINNDCSESKLDFMYENEEVIIPEEKEEIIFNTNKLLPDIFFNKKNRFSLIIEPLLYTDKCQGLIIFEKDRFNWDFYNQIDIILNNTLQGEILFSIMQQQKDELIHQKENLNINLQNLRAAMSGFVQTMSLTIEVRDPYTAGHQRRVSDLARTIATEMMLPHEQIEGIRMAATIHDLGKIYIPAEILNKPGKLSPVEFELIKNHSFVAYDILKNINFPWPLAEIVYQHHERIDGSGYPRGLKENEILLEAKIISVADVVEAMASHRPYRESLGIDKALEEISINKGKIYDQVIVEICVKLFLEKQYKFKY